MDVDPLRPDARRFGRALHAGRQPRERLGPRPVAGQQRTNWASIRSLPFAPAWHGGLAVPLTSLAGIVDLLIDTNYGVVLVYGASAVHYLNSGLSSHAIWFAGSYPAQ